VVGADTVLHRRGGRAAVAVSVGVAGGVSIEQSRPPQIGFLRLPVWAESSHLVTSAGVAALSCERRRPQNWSVTRLKKGVHSAWGRYRPLLLESLPQALGGQDLPLADRTGRFVQSDEDASREPSDGLQTDAIVPGGVPSAPSGLPGSSGCPLARQSRCLPAHRAVYRRPTSER
jgi:hypothetical protein